MRARGRRRCMLYIVRRTQIYLDDDQHRWLDEQARRQRRTKSELIREAVDRLIGGGRQDADNRLGRFQAAVDASFATVPDLPPGRDFVEDARATDHDRDRAVEDRWDLSSSTPPS